MAIAPCPQAPHATQNNIGKKHSRMTTANPVLSQTPLAPHRAPNNHGMAGKPKDTIIKRFIRSSNMIGSWSPTRSRWFKLLRKPREPWSSLPIHRGRDGDAQSTQEPAHEETTAKCGWRLADQPPLTQGDLTCLPTSRSLQGSQADSQALPSSVRCSSARSLDGRNSSDQRQVVCNRRHKRGIVQL